MADSGIITAGKLNCRAKGKLVSGGLLRMTSRQRVLTAFEHAEPDCVPCWCGASVEFWEKAKCELKLGYEGLRVRFGDDFRRVFAEYAGPEFQLSEGATSRTVFGIKRRALGWT